MRIKRKEQNQMRRSLDLAREIQQSLLPSSVPEVAGLDIAGQSIYREKTGGDYYDFLNFEKGSSKRVDIIIGDVAGHGLPSALLMITARALIRLRSSLPGSISDIVTDVNHHLSKDTGESGRFMTLFYLSIDLVNKSIKWVRAGHEPAILYNPHDDSFQKLIGPGIPLGVDQAGQFEECQEMGLAKGQIIVLNTDGIRETRNSRDEMFGNDSICEIIRQKKDAVAHEIMNSILEERYNFQSNSNPEDDFTIVVIKVNGDLYRSKMIPQDFMRKIPNTPLKTIESLTRIIKRRQKNLFKFLRLQEKRR
jgi:sigma-B regulation protein RsbU (phosphoserine phosphatase)